MKRCLSPSKQCKHTTRRDLHRRSGRSRFQTTGLAERQAALHLDRNSVNRMVRINEAIWTHRSGPTSFHCYRRRGGKTSRSPMGDIPALQQSPVSRETRGCSRPVAAGALRNYRRSRIAQLTAPTMERKAQERNSLFHVKRPDSERRRPGHRAMH